MHRLTVLLLLILLQLPVLAHATTRHLQFVEEANWPPFTPNRYGSVHEGLAYDLLRLVFNRINYSVELELTPQKRMLHYLQAGKKDGVSLISKNRERDEYILFSEPVIRKRGYIYYRSQGPSFSWQQYRDLRGQRIGIASGHNYGDEFTSAVAEHGLIVEEAPTVEHNFQKLLAGRVDLVFSTDSTALSILQRPEFRNRVRHAVKPYYDKSYHIGLSRKSTAVELMPKINEAIRQLQEDGELNALFNRHNLR